MMLTIQDILPWKSGGKKIEMDAVLPFFIVPMLMLLSTLSYEVTVTILTMISMGALYVQSRPTQKNRSPFFFSWTLASGIYLFLIFEIYVLALFEITQNEHFILLVLLAGSCYFFYEMKMTSQFGLASGPSKGKEYSPILTSDSCYCQICQIEVNERYFHTIWWDCCVVKTNYMYYLTGQLLAFCALLFGFDLALTTVCRPQLRDEPVLLAKSCENMYMEFDTALGFVGCACSITYLMVIGMILVHQGIVYVPKYLGPKMRRLMSVYSHI